MGITQEELAECAGLIPNYVGKLEIAMNAPSLSTLASLAEALEVDVGSLVTLGRASSHSDSVQEVARKMERLTEREERLLIEHIDSAVEMIVSLREQTNTAHE